MLGSAISAGYLLLGFDEVDEVLMEMHIELPIDILDVAFHGLIADKWQLPHDQQVFVGEKIDEP